MPGPAPGAICSVCNHPAIVLITKAINDGMSDRKIAGAFGFKHHGAIQRHRAHRHPGVKVGDPKDPPREVPPPPTDAGPREQLDWLVDQLRAQAEEGNIRADLARELRLALETQHKIGDNSPPPVVQVRDVAGLPQLFQEMHEALKPWPEAREAMRGVWRRHRTSDERPQSQPEAGDADPEED